MMWLFLKPMARKTPISIVRSLTLPIMVTKTIREPMKTTTAGHGIGKALELVQGLEAAFNHLLNGRHLGVGQLLGNLGDHVADRAAGAERRHLGQGDLALLAEQFLGLLQRGKDQGIILGAGLVKHAGDLEGFTLDGQAVARSRR